MAEAKQTKQDSADTKLILYRLDRVEGAVTDLGTKLDKQDNIKRQDLIEFRDTIVGRLTDLQASFQKQIDALDSEKASSQELKDFKKQIGAFALFLSALAVASYSYVLTRLK